MGNLKTKLDLMNYLTDRVKDYAPDCMESMIRNSHMNTIMDDNSMWNPIAPYEIEAILVDFVNYIGTHQGLDWGLYTHHLHEKG